MYELKFMERAYYDWHNPASLSYLVERVEGPFRNRHEAIEWAMCAEIEDYEVVEVND